jgi:diguanylate cyclase (GGDEF)-like protein/PAS domain S-box-containing protein
MPQKLRELVKNIFNQNDNVASQNVIGSNNFLPGEAKFQSFIEQLPVMFYAVDIEPPYAPFYISPAFQSLGYSLEDWQKPNFWVETIHPDDRGWVLGKTRNAIKAGENLDYEYRIVGKDGLVRWVRDRGCLIRNERDEISYWQGIIIDISEQKQIESELKRREGMYRTIARNIPLTAVVFFDHDLRFTLAEGEQLARMGLTPQMIEGKTIFEVFPPDISEEWSRYHKAVLAGGFISIERKVNETIFQNYIIPLKNEKKEIYGGMSIWQDITETKKIAAKIRESEDRYRDLFEGASDLVYVHDLQGNYISINRAGEKIFGYQLAEISKLNMKDVIAPEHLKIASEMLSEKLKDGAKKTVYELDCITHDNKRVTLEINSSLVFKDGNPVAVQGIARDVTERKQMQAALVESEERLRNLFDNANDLIYFLDSRGYFLTVNKAVEELFEYSTEEFRRMHFSKIVERGYLELANQLLAEKLDGLTRTVFEIYCVTKTGRKVLIEVNSSPMIKNGQVVAIQGIARDITERRRAEKRIQESEAELQALFTAMSDLVLVFDRDGRYLKIPPTNTSLLYRPVEELLGKTLHDVFPKEKADAWLIKIHEALEKQQTVTLEYSLTLDGKTRWFSSLISPMEENSVVTVARDITNRKQSEEALHESEAKHRDLFEKANDLIYTVDLQGNFTSLNRAGERISGYSRKEALQKNFSEVVAPEYLEKAKTKIVEKLSNKKSSPYEIEIITKKGHRVALELSTRLIVKNGVPVGIQGIGRDISDRKKAEEAIKHSEREYRLLSEGIMHQVWTAKPDGKLDYVNGRTLKYFGKRSKELIDDNWMSVVHPEDLTEAIEHWTHSLVTGDLYETEFRLKRKDGVYRWHRALATAGRDANGKIVKWFGTNTDIHDQKTAEEQLNHLAKHDVLTNLPNRAKFVSNLERVIKRYERGPGQRFAVLFLDLDRFKLINDTLGHLIGDKLLVKFAERLETCVRPGDMVARLGGDEFTVLLNNLDSPTGATRVANRLIQSLTKPFKIDKYEVFTSASIGIVISDKVAREAEDYLRDADTAMYRAKESGKARYEVFNSQMHVRNMTLLRIESDLRRALERNEFQVFYQPIVSLQTGEIHEFEALIRWQHPNYGLIEPQEFIKIAEDTGLIIPIGKWILAEACRQISDWQKSHPQAIPFFISVNLSSKQLMHPPFVTQIKEILNQTGLKPNHLRLEVTESVVMDNDELALEVLNQLKEIGVSLSTDDFGTGFSSLSYLHRFPFDCLKIDRSFIGNMDTNGKSAEIVRTILMLAQNLNLEAVAEGIETEEQLKQLQHLGCRFGQGYFFSKPVNSKGIEHLLLERSKGFCFTVPPDFQNTFSQSTIIN